jgi:phosphoribosylaminoimidazole-succinocarboxamide synthase
LPNGIPRKGEVLTRLSLFWFARLGVKHHLISTDLTTLPLPPGTDLASLAARSMVVMKTEVVPVECVVRGYLSGSGWKEYQKSGTVCGIKLPAGLKESSELPEPIFTPATKAETGHDENITFEQMCGVVGNDLSRRLRDLSLQVYHEGCSHARTKGIIIADTKFEFGLKGDDIILIDEVMTPDSSRFWPADDYAAGRGQASFDKQFVRDWLEQSGWDKNSPPPELPQAVIDRTSKRYIEAFERLTGQQF